ncbi:pentapeptide repeat-containing protein, partial [candidate division KSB1 bacterium]|nr:pentapeptide repeat-containing protein [candidate division KSB1 bacterium]
MFFHNQDIISLLTNIFDIKQFTILKIIGGISTILIIIKTILELKTKWKDNKALKIINNEITFEFFDEETIKSYTDIYIEPYCSPSDPSYTEDLKKIYGEKKHEKLFTKIDEFLSEGAKNRHMYLLGDSGTGKTAALINILMRNYRHKKFSKKQIIVLRLNAKNVDQCIKNIENKKNTILFLDAFDEDPFAIESINTRYNQLVDITEGFNRVLISSRTQFFPNSAAIKRKTSIPNINADQSDGYRMFTIQYLLPFNDEQVQKFIKKKYSILNYKLRRKAWQIISAAPSLALRPMLLKYMSSFMDPNKEYKNSYDIYEEIIIHWINRERISDKVALRRFSEALANHLYRYQKENNGQIPRHELVPFALTHKIDLNELELSSRSLLNRDGYGNYKFSHRSILEFLFINYFVKLPVKDRVFLDWTDQIKKFVAELVKLHYSQEIDLSEADLTGLNFSDCNLSGLKLVRANLMGANLNNVNLMEAVLTEANLRDADLKGAVISEANLGKADLRRAKLNNATLSEVILCNANLSDSILNEAYLSGADLEGICLSNADLKGANLEGTNLSNADLKSANLNNTSLAGANLTSSILTNAELSYSNLKGAKLCKAILNGANFSMANLSNADLQDANIQGINLKGSILFQTNF